MKYRTVLIWLIFAAALIGGLLYRHSHSGAGNLDVTPDAMKSIDGARGH